MAMASLFSCRAVDVPVEGSCAVKRKRTRIRRSIDSRFCMKTDTACYRIPTGQRMHRSLRGPDSRLRNASISHRAIVSVLLGDGRVEKADSVRSSSGARDPCSRLGLLTNCRPHIRSRSPRPKAVTDGSRKPRALGELLDEGGRWPRTLIVAHHTRDSSMATALDIHIIALPRPR